MIISFIVPGEPIAKARARVFYNKNAGRVMAYTPTKTANFENWIKQIAIDYKPQCGLLCTPLKLRVIVYRSMPKSFSLKKIQAAEKGMILPTTKPDLDNYIKSIKDALQKLIYQDDSQIVELTARKEYALSTFKTDDKEGFIR